MTKSERMAKTILYKDKVQDLYTICPKMLLQNENYSKGVRQQGKEQEDRTKSCTTKYSCRLCLHKGHKP